MQMVDQTWKVYTKSENYLAKVVLILHSGMEWTLDFELLYFLADPGEARGCSTNTFVIN